MSILPLIYVVYNQYKDNKKKDSIINAQKMWIECLEKENSNKKYPITPDECIKL
jgi:hypothetical protein